MFSTVVSLTCSRLRDPRNFPRHLSRIQTAATRRHWRYDTKGIMPCCTRKSAHAVSPTVLQRSQTRSDCLLKQRLQLAALVSAGDHPHKLVRMCSVITYRVRRMQLAEASMCNADQSSASMQINNQKLINTLQMFRVDKLQTCLDDAPTLLKDARKHTRHHYCSISLTVLCRASVKQVVIAHADICRP